MTSSMLSYKNDKCVTVSLRLWQVFKISDIFNYPYSKTTDFIMHQATLSICLYLPATVSS